MEEDLSDGNIHVMWEKTRRFPCRMSVETAGEWTSQNEACPHRPSYHEIKPYFRSWQHNVRKRI